MKSVDLNEFKEVAKKLNALPKEYRKETKTILGKAARPVRKAIRNEAPISTKEHVIKDGGGTTKKVKPGNLRKAVQIFTFKRTWDVFVGPVASKRMRGKSVKGVEKLSRRFRAFYWRFIYYGAYGKAPDRFIDRGADKGKIRALAIMKVQSRKLIAQYAKKKGLK